MRYTTLVFVAMLAGATSCTIGKNAAGWPVAKLPHGATVTLRSDPTTITAELIEVTEDGVVVKTQAGKLIFAPFSKIDNLAANQLGSAYTMGRRMPPTQPARERLTTVSHFPQGMTPEIRQRMLALSGQSQVETLQ